MILCDIRSPAYEIFYKCIKWNLYKRNKSHKAFWEILKEDDGIKMEHCSSRRAREERRGYMNIFVSLASLSERSERARDLYINV